jgi:hypothetical protein
MTFPTSRIERDELRSRRQAQGAAKGRALAIETYKSIRCFEGVCAPDGCQNDGTGCLCGCHDASEEPTP